MSAVSATPRKTGKPAWVNVVARYQISSLTISTWQILNTFIPFVVLLVLAYFALQVSFWLSLPISILAGGFMMRIFIIQHDCGHNSFFRSRKLNDLVGTISGVISMTPYEFWRSSHAKHHATSGDLDFRGYGDVWTMTVKEYLAASPRKRLQYRLYRFPLITFVLGPLPMFAILQRSLFMWKRAEHKRERRSLLITDIALLSIVVIMSLLIGLDKFLLIWLPASLVASSAGVFLFYVQHQFEDTYWRYHPEWDYTAAALEGSSYFKLPKPLQWISGNIGLHHIHHLSPKIPNYLLQQAFDENPEFRNSPTLTLKTAFQVITNGLAVWDEEQDRLINFKEVHDRYLGGDPNGKPVTPVVTDPQGADK